MHINDWIKVRLTPAGVEILRQQHEMMEHRLMLRTGGTATSSPFTVRTDEDGYTSFQLWDLMARFGPFIGLRKPEPFIGEMIVLGATIIDDRGKGGAAAAQPSDRRGVASEPGTFHCSKCNRETRNHRFCLEASCIDHSPRGWYHEDAGGTTKPSIVEWGFYRSGRR